MKIELSIPFLPALELSSNRRRTTHWTLQSKATKKTKTDFALFIQPQLNRKYADVLQNAPYSGRFAVEVTLTFPNKRKRDVDGMVPMIKPLLDIFTGYLWVDDSMDIVHKLTIAAKYEKGIERTEIIICFNESD